MSLEPDIPKTPITVSSIATTRSTKVNICFSIALLLASLLFFLHDVLVKEDNSGVIKLVIILKFLVPIYVR